MITLENIISEADREKLSCDDKEALNCLSENEGKTRPCLQELPVERGGIKKQD